MAVSFDRVAHRYDETRGGDKRGGEFAGAVRPWLADGLVLEVGVGTGVVAAALAADGTSVVGVDVSPLMAARAVERLGPRVVLGDALMLPVADGRFASVLFVMSLHLVGDVPAALAEAARALRPGGRVVALHGGPRSQPTDLDGALVTLFGTRVDRPDSDEAVDAAAAGAGLRLIHRGFTPQYPVVRTPNQMAAEISDRVWSYLWHLDDATWEAHAAPAIRALRALPEPDRGRDRAQRMRLSVYAI